MVARRKVTLGISWREGLVVALVGTREAQYCSPGSKPERVDSKVEGKVGSLGWEAQYHGSKAEGVDCVGSYAMADVAADARTHRPAGRLGKWARSRPLPRHMALLDTLSRAPPCPHHMAICILAT